MGGLMRLKEMNKQTFFKWKKINEEEQERELGESR